MKEYTVDAIILKSLKSREADRILTLYTRQAGKKTAMAHGVEKPFSKKRGAVQPFGYSRLQLRRGRDLDSVAQGEGIEIFPALRASLEGLAGASYMAELVDAFTMDEDPNPPIFQLLLETFRLLGGKHDFVAARSFEIKLVSLLGYRPGLEACVLCDTPAAGEELYFLPEHGGVVCRGCCPSPGREKEMTRGALENMKVLLRWETARIHQIRVDRSAGDEIKNAMRRFIDHRLDRGIKSRRFDDLLGRR